MPVAAPRTLTFLKPEHFARIRNLHLWAKLIVEGTTVGVHRSPYHGFSAEFLEYRRYQPGESTRMIDWRKYAKTDTSVVRLFQDETNLRAHLLLDTSASMAFCSPGLVSKHTYGSVLCAAAAWILVRQRDAVGFAAFDEQTRVLLTPRSTNVQLRNILVQLDGLRPAGRTGAGAAMDHLAARIARRGMCVVVSDLLDDIGALERGLRHLRFKRQDVLVLWLRDPMERRFEHASMLRLRDMETGQRLELDPAVAAAHYRAGMAAHARQVDSLCRDLAVDLTEVGTEEPVERALSRIVQKRRRRQ
jgi:uncharacterized protein (DUF58 family)